MSLRDELLAGAEPDPRGFTMLAPPSWERLTPDDAGRTRLEGLVRERMRSIARPDLDGLLRHAIREQWRSLVQQRALAIYMPVEASIEGGVPASIVVVPWAVRGGALGDDLRARVEAPIVEVDVGAGVAYRWVEELRTGAPVDGLEDADRLPSRQISMVVPFPHADPRRGALLRGAIAHPGVAEAGPALDAFTTLVDSIMGTFRWRM